MTTKDDIDHQTQHSPPDRRSKVTSRTRQALCPDGTHQWRFWLHMCPTTDIAALRSTPLMYYVAPLDIRSNLIIYHRLPLLCALAGSLFALQTMLCHSTKSTSDEPYGAAQSIHRLLVTLLAVIFCPPAIITNAVSAIIQFPNASLDSSVFYAEYLKSRYSYGPDGKPTSNGQNLNEKFGVNCAKLRERRAGPKRQTAMLCLRKDFVAEFELTTTAEAPYASLEKNSVESHGDCLWGANYTKSPPDWLAIVGVVEFRTSDDFGTFLAPHSNIWRCVCRL